MNLLELEITAGRLLDEKRRLRTIEGELSRLQADLKELPRRAEKDKKFYSLIGLNWEEPHELMRLEEELRKEREVVLKAISEAHETIVRGFSTDGLVVPLEPDPEMEAGHYFFRYRSEATFPKTLEALSELLGIQAPMKIDDVTIWADKIGVVESDPYFAKTKIVEAFDKIRKTVSLKLAPRSMF